ncbi:hypothetical protein DIPPA_18750 [Diplonema papillatum]|nr:hypothetical protein DIPPA_18750 [Diplonema papillatum]
MPDPQYLPRGTLRPRSSPSAAAAYQHELQSRAAAVSVDAAARSADVDAFIDTSIYPKGGGRCAWSPDGFRGPAVSRRGNASGASSFVVVPPLSAHTSVRKSKSREAQERERYNLSTRSSPSPPAAHGCRTRSGMNLRASVDDVPLRVVKSATLGLSCSRPPRLQQAEYSPRPLPSFGREPSSPFSPSGSLRSTESRTSHNASRGVYSVPIGDGCPQTWESLPQSQARLRSSRSQRDTSASCQQSALRNSTPLPVFEVGTKTPPETVALEDRIANEAAEEVSRRTRERKLQEFDMADTRRLAVSAERSARIFILHEHKVACNILYIVCIDSKRAAFEATESRIRSAVSKQQCQEALWLLADPDIRSITFDRQEADGRRVVAELEEQVCRQLNASRNRSWTAAFHAANVAPVVRRTLEEELSARMGIEEECARWVVTQTWVKAQKVKSRQHLLLKEKERRSVTVSERAPPFNNPQR